MQSNYMNTYRLYVSQKQTPISSNFIHAKLLIQLIAAHAAFMSSFRPLLTTHQMTISINH